MRDPGHRTLEDSVLLSCLTNRLSKLTLTSQGYAFLRDEGEVNG